MQQTSLRQRLLITFIGLAVIPLMISAMIVANHTYQHALEESYKLQQELSKRVKVEVKSLFQSSEIRVMTALRTSMFEQLNTEQRRKVLVKILAQRQLFNEAVFIDSDRLLRINVSNLRVAKESQILTKNLEQVFKETIRSAKLNYSAIYFDNYSNEPMITMGIPLYEQFNGKFIGVVCIELRFKAIWDLLSGLKLDVGEELFITDSRGKLVAHPKASIVLRGESILINNKQRQLGLQSTDVTRVLDRFEVGNRELIVVVERAAELAVSKAEDQIWKLLPIFVLTLLVAFILFIGLSKYLLRPIIAISKAARAIRDGDWQLTVKVEHKDELGEMAKAFNSMIERLSNTLNELEKENIQRARAEKKLSLANDHLETLTQFETDWVYWRSEDKQHFYYMSPTCEAFTGYQPEDFQNDPLLLDRIIHPEDSQRWKNHAHNRDKSGNLMPEEFRIIDKTGQTRWISHTCRAVLKDNQSYGRRGSNQDITDRKLAEQRIQLAANVFTHAREGIMITNRQGKIIEVNSAFEVITGYGKVEVVGKNPNILSSGRHGADFYIAMWKDLETYGHWNGEIWDKRKNGETYAELLTISVVCDNNGQPVNYVGLFSDITDIKKHQEKLEYIAHYDALTNLPNRLLLSDRLKQSMSQVKRRNKKLAVVYLDLDGFKAINDGYGHAMGDQLLTKVAGRMKQAMRQGDTVARIGGDEFVAVFVDLEDTNSTIPLLNRLLDASSKPIQIDTLGLQVSASLGVTFYPQKDEVEADQLLRQADQAMYQAKIAGKNRFYVFDAELDRDVRGRHEGIESIKKALANREFILYYQPKVNMQSGEIIGAEALIRWLHPEKGLLPPGYFLPVIEEHELSIELGDWIFERAFKQITDWNAMGFDIPISINVSAFQLQQIDFVENLRNKIKNYPQLKTSSVILEVLETSALEDINHVSDVINDCRSMGIKFSLDDFGTGYSSLTYLKRLPASELKIDRSFVRDILDDPEDMAIIEGVLSLSQAFGRSTVAEGVETIEHGEMLLLMGCYLAQGFAIAHPMPAKEFLQWSKQWNPDPMWKHLNAVKRDDFPLLYAATNHRAWVRQIERFIVGSNKNFQAFNDDECDFGQWLKKELLLQNYDNKELVLLDELHKRIHHLAIELIKIREQGQEKLAISRLDDLYHLRDKLLLALKSLLN